MPEHVVRWHQPEPEAVARWEFQFQRVGRDDFEWVVRVEPVAEACVDCFEAIVELPETALAVRSRSIGAEGESQWSHPLPVHPAPEPAFGMALAVCVLGLLAAANKKPRSARGWRGGGGKWCG